MLLDATKHSEIFFIGDLHGDIQPLLETLKLTGCVAIPSNAMASAQKCYMGETDRSGYPLTDAQQRDIKWVGTNQVIVFLGDVLDNRRSSSDDTIGRCQKTGTQFQIMNIIIQLKRQAQKTGGDVIWCLGNHDVENVINTEGSFCKRYAPLTQFDGMMEYNTCNPTGGYSDTHRTNVRRKLKDADVCALLLLTNGNDGVLACHGGLTDMKTLARVLKLRSGEVANNVNVFDKLFQTALLQPRHPYHQKSIDVIEKYSNIMPTWCRPSCIENKSMLEKYFQATKMVKGHDIQLTGDGDPNPNCNVSGKQRSMGGGNKTKMADGEICRIDVAMSRCFKTRKLYCVLGITVQNHDFHRTLYTTR